MACESLSAQNVESTLSSYTPGSEDKGLIHAQSGMATCHVYMGQQAGGVDSPVSEPEQDESLHPRLEQGGMS